MSNTVRKENCRKKKSLKKNVYVHNLSPGINFGASILAG